MKVELIDHMGSDLTVVNAARVSFDKHHKVFEADSDVKLINFLARNDHWTPFAHPQVQLRITVPLFVAAQLKRHQVGAAVNEVSRRYVDSEPEFASIVWRSRHESAKQGSAGDFEDIDQGFCDDVLEHLETIARNSYKTLLEFGVAPEQARAVLPQTMMTSWYWTASLYFWGEVVQATIRSSCTKRNTASSFAHTRDC